MVRVGLRSFSVIYGVILWQSLDLMRVILVVGFGFLGMTCSRFDFCYERLARSSLRRSGGCVCWSEPALRGGRGPGWGEEIL